MAFEVNGIRFLLAARASGTSFQKVVMIGRQGLAIDAKLLQATLRRFGTRLDDDEIRRLFTAGLGYAEPLLELLGAAQVSSIDASPYEGASLTHDMNKPIPSELRGAFSAVIDGGCLEHIFDLPRALRNCMEMVRVGGHFLGIAPANNCMGHGFYQFSPELFFRVFSEANGFAVERMVACEIDQDADWYDVRDPAVVGRRIEIINAHRTYLLIRARRLVDRPLLESIPQQSDYAMSWMRSAEGRREAPGGFGGESAGGTDRAAPESTAQGRLRKWVGRVTPAPWKRRFRRLLATTGESYRRAGYTKVEVPRG
jgi:SAM-dependent methyltransferase